MIRKRHVLPAHTTHLFII